MGGRMDDCDILLILGGCLEPSRAAPGKTGGMMPQTRPRGLTGSVTTGRTADPYTHARARSHTHTLSHTTQSEVGRVGGGGGFVREGRRS